MVAEQNFLTFVAGLFEVPVESLSLETAYQSIPQWDSVMHLRLVMEIEGEYGVTIPLDEIGNVKTLKDVYAFVDK